MMGGNETSQIEISPWMVQVYTTHDGTSVRCGGSIIASRFVVTAAHCVLDMDAEDVWIRLGGFFPGDSIEFNLVRRIIVHPGYNRALLDNDIALLETKLPIDLKTYAPVCLRKSTDTFDYEMAQVIVYRDGIQRKLDADLLPPSFCSLQSSDAGLRPVSLTV